jgi:predicted nucleic acid-binding protein
LPTSSPVKKLAADANVILSAVAGKAALRVFLKEELEIITTEFNIEEVNEYFSVMSEKYDLSKEILESQLKLLPLKVFSSAHYADFLSKARKKMSGKDQDDVELLALALRMKIPVWTNDRDFRNTGVQTYTTAQLLKLLKC